MKPEQQRIAIAEACGWFHMNSCWHFPNGAKATADGGPDNVPDYLNDLNAMHEVESFLMDNEPYAYQRYGSNLYEAYGNTVHLTAAERAEAFLKTMNLWKP